MKTPYKLKNEIKQFIIDKKKVDLKLSCRRLVDLIRENFNTEISKSTINAVIKERDLSSPVGRTRIRARIIEQPLLLAKLQPVAENPVGPLVLPEKAFSEPAVKPEEKVLVQPPNLVSETRRLPEEERFSEQPIEIKAVKKEEKGLRNGGCLLLKIADLKSSLTPSLVEKFAPYLPGMPKDSLCTLIEALIYLPVFKDKNSLWQFLGKEISEKSLSQYSQKLAQIPVSDLNGILMRLGLGSNINEINGLYKNCLLQLNSTVQGQFFPAGYKFLDFSTMYSRFYSLFARVEKRAGLCAIQLFYPEDFPWLQDIVWQEDFSYVAQKINEDNISTISGEKVWVKSKVDLWH